MEEYVYMECDSIDCDIAWPHWVVYHKETGAGVADYEAEWLAKREAYRLNNQS